MNNAYSRPGPSFEALFEVNQQLQYHSASSDNFAQRFDEPPPSYHSPSHSPSQASFQEAPRAEEEEEDDDPATLERLAKEARAFPLLREQHKYDGWTREQIQRDINAWKRLGKEVERRKLEEKQIRHRLLTSGPSYGLFEDNGSSKSDEPTDPLQGEGTLKRKRKRRRTETEMLLGDVQEAASLDPRVPKRVCRNQLKKGVNGASSKVELNKSLVPESNAVLRRSKRIANLVKADSNVPDGNSPVKTPWARITEKTNSKRLPSPRSNPSRQTGGKMRQPKSSASKHLPSPKSNPSRQTGGGKIRQPKSSANTRPSRKTRKRG